MPRVTPLYPLATVKPAAGQLSRTSVGYLRVAHQQSARGEPDKNRVATHSKRSATVVEVDFAARVMPSAECTKNGPGMEAKYRSVPS